MKILDYRIYEGKNIYSHKKSIKLTVDLEGYKDIPSSKIPNFNYNILNILPELREHRCGIYQEGGFVIRLEEGTYLAHICEHMIIAMHNRIGIDICFGKAREIKDDLYYIIFQYSYKQTALAIANLAVELVNALTKNIAIDFHEQLEHIKAIMKREVIGPSTEAICSAALERGIPVMSLGDSGYYQLGYGKQGRVIEAAISPETSCVGVDISCDKLLTKKLLDQQWIPVPQGAKVHNALELLKLADNMGYPVVLKPQYGSKGSGVCINIKDDIDLMEKYSELKGIFNDLIIEKCHKGKDYRVCVVDYKVCAVALRIPPFVMGNGSSTIIELIEEINSQESRGDDHEKPLTKIKIDGDVLRCLYNKNYNLDMVLSKGESLFLRENANISTGGVAIDCTEEICSENIEICIRAAKALGLDICGIDLCCNDISKPLQGQQGVVLEVNAAPGLRMHHYPFRGEKRDVAGAIVDMLFKESPKSIPIISITGTNGKTTTTRLIGHTLSLMGYKVGMTTTGGIYIDKTCIATGDTTGVESAKTVLLNREVEVAVLETARGGIIRNGLGYDLADVAVITNISDDHLGIEGINSLEDLALVKALVAEAVKVEGYAVLNGDDYWSMSILERVKSNKIIFSKTRENKYLLDNLKAGGFGIYLKEDLLCVEKDQRVYTLCSVKDIPITYNGLLSHNIENAMAATAALLGSGVDYCMITKGLMSFLGNEVDNPGRFNVYDFNNFKVILDYGHNIEGYKAVLCSLKQLKHKRLVGIIGVPGDRLKENVIELGRISSDHLDHIYIKEDRDKRGRCEGEIASLLEKGVKEKGFKNYDIILDEVDALKVAIENAQSGDLIVLFFEDYKRVCEFLKDCNVLESKANIV